MKKIITALCALMLLVGCSGGDKNSGGTQSTACSFEAAEGMSVNFNVGAKDDTINKLVITVNIDYDTIGYDLSTLSDSMKESTADQILSQLGLSQSASGIEVKVDFTDKAMNAVVTVDLETADPTVLNSFGFNGISDEDLSFTKFLSQANEYGMECK